MTLLCVTVYITPAWPATFFNYGINPADGGSLSDAAARDVTPPGSMVPGQLVVVRVIVRSGTEDISQVDAGGQTWTELAEQSVGASTQRIYCAVYNGTWDANPSWQSAGQFGAAMSVMMLVYSPSASGTWSCTPDVALAYSGATATTQTITGQTPTSMASVVTIAGWVAAFDVLSWSSLTGGWETRGPDVSVTNLEGTGTVQSVADLIQSSAGATGNVSLTLSDNQSANRFIVTFAETISAAPAFDSGPTFDSLDSNTVRVTYDADAVADQIHCAVWPVDTSAPADGAAVEAASGASGSAFEATTGASDTIDIDVSESPAHPYYDGYCALETGTSSYSSVGSGIDIEMDPASDCGAGADELCGSPVTLTSVVQGSIFAIADLNYDAQSANFVLDEWVTGGTSGAVGYVLADTDAGTTGTLQLWIVSGTFADDEALTGDGAGVFAPGAAVVNGVAAYYYAANDIVVAPFSVLPFDVPLIIADDGGTSYADSSGVRISALLIRVFDRSAQDYHAELVVWWDQEPGPSCQGQTISYVIKTGVEIGTADTQPIVFHDADPEVGQICGHPLGDALTASLYQGTLYTGLSLTSNVLGAGDTVADMDEDEDGEAWYFRVVSDVTGAATYQRIDGYAWDTLTLVDCTTAPLTGAECQSAVESQYLGAVTVNVTYEYSDTVAANDTISQDPAADAELAPFGEVNLVVSLGVQPEGGAGARRNIGIGIRIGL